MRMKNMTNNRQKSMTNNMQKKEHGSIHWQVILIIVQYADMQNMATSPFGCVRRWFCGSAWHACGRQVSCIPGESNPIRIPERTRRAAW